MTSEAELIIRQISWLRVYCSELNNLEQPGMPIERHQTVMSLRQTAPQFFWLTSALINDALILGLDNILDSSKKGKQLTLECIVDGIQNTSIKTECQAELARIRKSPCVKAITIARNHRISHPNRETLIQENAIRDANLSFSALETLLCDVSKLAAKALNKQMSDFFFEGWEGVSQLFTKLLDKTDV